jgi:hypothetical protein
MFKNVDKKFSEIGFVKIKEDEFGATYERENEKFNFVQTLDLLHKQSGKHLIQSSEKGVNTDGFGNMVGLTMYETKLALKKMRQMGWKPVK